HHENEIAQTEATTGETMCRHWFHITHLMVNGGKMSKSEGNFYTLGDLEEKGFTAAELRYVLMAAHYRQPLNFVAKDRKTGEETFDSLRSARQALKNLAKAEKAWKEAAGNLPSPSYEDLLGRSDMGPFTPAWHALLNDLNTPEALGKLFTALKESPPTNPAEAKEAWRSIHLILHALGLLLPEEEAAAEVPAEIRNLAQQRWKAKQEKDWAEADRLREAVQATGWQIKDTKDGFTIVPNE
ncbi:MAG: DALR domain-containing protein, partial [Verrucomicrobiota bacterium]